MNGKAVMSTNRVLKTYITPIGVRSLNSQAPSTMNEKNKGVSQHAKIACFKMGTENMCPWNGHNIHFATKTL